MGCQQQTFVNDIFTYKLNYSIEHRENWLYNRKGGIRGQRNENVYDEMKILWEI